MENRPGQPAQGMGPQSQESVSFPLRPGEQVVFVTRWDGGWANSIATFVILGIACLAGLIMGGFWAFVGLVFGFATIIKLTLEVLSRISGRAVLTNQRIVVKGLPSPFISKEIELTDVEGVSAGVDLVRAGGGMSTMTVISRSGSKKGIVIPNAAKFVEAYNTRARG
jgi:hypothetical protein